MRIACDIDGVVANMIPHLRNSVLQECGYDIDGKIDRYDFYKDIPNLPREVWEDLVGSILCCQQIVEPYVEAKIYLPLLYSDKFIFITARREEFIPETKRWLAKHFSIPINVISRSSKHKLTYLLDNRYNILIEDRYRTANEAADHMHVFLVNRPWNIGRPVKENVIRVESLKQIAQILLGR